VLSEVLFIEYELAPPPSSVCGAELGAIDVGIIASRAAVSSTRFSQISQTA
jgi:hypothetical protein